MGKNLCNLRCKLRESLTYCRFALRKTYICKLESFFKLLPTYKLPLSIRQMARPSRIINGPEKVRNLFL